MRMLAAMLLGVVCAAPALTQAGALTQVAAPEFVPVLTKVPLQEGLTVAVEWIPLRGRSGPRVYECTAENVTEDSLAHRVRRNNVLHTIENRVDCENYTGDWSESRDDTLPHTWPWIPLLAAQQLQEGQIGQTTVRLGDLLAREMREYLFVGTHMIPLMGEDGPVLAPCWVIVSSNGATISVLADAENPLMINSYEPGVSMQRALSISGAGIELGALEG